MSTNRKPSWLKRLIERFLNKNKKVIKNSKRPGNSISEKRTSEVYRKYEFSKVENDLKREKKDSISNATDICEKESTGVLFQSGAFVVKEQLTYDEKKVDVAEQEVEGKVCEAGEIQELDTAEIEEELELVEEDAAEEEVEKVCEAEKIQELDTAEIEDAELEEDATEQEEEEEVCEVEEIQ